MIILILTTIQSILSILQTLLYSLILTDIRIAAAFFSPFLTVPLTHLLVVRIQLKWAVIWLEVSDLICDYI